MTTVYVITALIASAPGSVERVQGQVYVSP